jgi:signal transduction histidine kinase/HAMP domain-containing protein/ActR/RegA family two-component response regulator
VKVYHHDARRKTRVPLLGTVKAKLIVAFGLIVGLGVVVSSIGWRGFSDTAQSLNLLRVQSLPDMSNAMELARRSAAIAAIAPFIGSIQVMNKLNIESGKLDEQLAKFETLVDAVEPIDNPRGAAVQGSLRALAAGFEADLRDLVVNTRDGLGIHSDMLELRFAFDKRVEIEARLRGNAGVPAAGERLAAFQGLVDATFATMGSDSPMRISRLEEEFAEFAAKLGPGPYAKADDPETAALEEFIAGQARVFELRRRQLVALERTEYLLASIHALSTQLSDRVSEVAARTIEAAQARSLATNAALERGKNRILLLALISVFVGVAAALYVLRNLAGNLQAVTAAMTRLASGDRTTNVPAVERVDELGSLARAFNIFKEQSFDREALANDLVAKSRTLATTFANMTDGMSVFDSAGRLVAWNSKFVEINELDPATIRQGVTFHEIFEQLAKIGSKAVFQDGADMNADELFRRRRNEIMRYEQIFRDDRLIELKSQPTDGGFATIYTDLTERRAVERQLREAQRMEVVGQLASGMAHDFNNLLAAISANLEMIHEALHERPDLTPRILRALEAAERGAALTQRLLAFSRQQALQPEVTDINALIREVLNLVDCSLDPSIAVEANLQSAVDNVFVDPGQLENAILNLVFNSRDAMPHGGRIVVSTSIAPSNEYGAGDGLLRIVVEDDGVGMTPDVLARVYEPFFTTKEMGRGSGLGLSMVYGFVSQSGGRVEIASQPGAGTAVSIILPVTPAAAPIRERQSSEVGNDVVQGGGERVLIVEDDSTVRETVTDVLKSLGYQTVAVGSVEQARTELERSSFDLVFTDYMLPDGMNGGDVATYAQGLQPNIAVLYTSGFPRDRLACDEPQTDPVKLIGKPYRKETLAGAIRQLIDARQSNPTRSTAALKR